MSFVVRSLRSFTLALVVGVAGLSVAATVGQAQTRADSASATRGSLRGGDTSAARTPSAACEGTDCAADGDGFSGAVRRLQIALRNVGRASNGQAGGGDFAIPLRFSDLDRYGAFVKLMVTLGLFAIGIWGILNPKSILVVALWAAGFLIARYGQTRGHLIAGVAAACAYWWLLHFLGARASRKWGRKRLRPTVYKPS
jgi:hypothetical protein